MADYRLLFKDLREDFDPQGLEELVYAMFAVTGDKQWSPGQVFSQPGNLGRMATDIQEHARRRGHEVEFIQQVIYMRPSRYDQYKSYFYGYDFDKVKLTPTSTGYSESTQNQNTTQNSSKQEILNELQKLQTRIENIIRLVEKEM